MSMHYPRAILIACLSATIAMPSVAQNLNATSSVTTQPLRDVHATVSSQPLSNGVVTHQVQLHTAAGEAPVTVRTIQPERVAGNYHIDFDALDSDHDGYISRSEAQANPSLADEFDALDTPHSGRLSRTQLAGWR